MRRRSLFTHRAILRTPEERFDFLRQFAAANLDQAPQLDQYKQSLLAFVAPPDLREAAKAQRLGFPGPFTDAELRAIHAEVRRFMDWLRTNPQREIGRSYAPYTTPTVPVEFTMSRSPTEAWTGVDATKVAGLVYADMIDTVAQLRGPVRICEAPGCTQPYITMRSNAKYCSKPCQQRVMVSRFLDKRRQTAAEARRAYYEKQKSAETKRAAQRRSQKGKK